MRHCRESTASVNSGIAEIALGRTAGSLHAATHSLVVTDGLGMNCSGLKPLNCFSGKRMAAVLREEHAFFADEQERRSHALRLSAGKCIMLLTAVDRLASPAAGHRAREFVVHD